MALKQPIMSSRTGLGVVVRFTERLGLRYYCRCGLHFSSKGHLNNHIEICNRPLLSPDDEHCRVSEEEWREQRKG